MKIDDILPQPIQTELTTTNQQEAAIEEEEEAETAIVKVQDGSIKSEQEAAIDVTSSQDLEPELGMPLDPGQSFRPSIQLFETEAQQEEYSIKDDITKDITKGEQLYLKYRYLVNGKKLYLLKC